MEELIREAEAVQGSYTLGDHFCAGAVGAAIRTRSKTIYTGISIELACGIGFCAEHSAVAEMLKNRETQITAAVAVSGDGIIPPCGRCRELMIQVDERNLDAEIMVSENEVMTLRELLPRLWY